MPGPPKQKRDELPADEKSWADDQREHGYYYDDAHGYVEYAPDEDEDDEEPRPKTERPGPYHQPEP